MFDEYFNPPTIVVSPVPVVVAPRAVDLADSPVSTSIDQDAPSAKPKNFKQAMTESTWIDAMQEEIHKFERLQVWELVSCLDKVLLIKLKWIYKVKTDEFGVKALDDTLVAPVDRLEFGKCNIRLKTDIKPKEARIQVVMDALALTLLYRSFLITAAVLAIYMQEFWATICPIIPGQEFKGLPLEHDILSFVRDLGHTRDITYPTDVNVDYLHQPWRAFSIVINKCLSGKETRIDKIRLSRTIIKTKAKVAKSNKKKQPVKKPKAKGLVVLSESKVPDEQQQNTPGTDEGTGTIPGVPDVPIYDSKSDKESWGDSDEEDDDEKDFKEEADINDDDSDDNDESDDERMESDSDVIPDPNKTNVKHDEEEEEYDDEFNLEEDENIDEEENDEVTKELYKDVNVNLGNKDADITYVDQEIKQVDQYAQAFSSIPTIVDRYMDNKLGEAINKAIQAYNFNCREESQAKKRESSSQPQSSYEATATLSEFKLTKILIDKIEKNKSYDVCDYKRELYDALVKSYNTDKDIFESYGEVFSLKRSRDDKDKDKYPSAGSDRGTKRRKLSKDAESSKDSRHTIRLGVHHNYEQHADNEVTKADWFKKPKRTPTPDPNWSKRWQVDFRPPQTWISQVSHAEEPLTSFDELNDTSFDFSTFFINRLNIQNLTQEILVGPAFNLLKGTCKSITELEKPLLLIQDQRGLQIIPKDYFINKDLEYLKGRDLSRKYSTSVTKTKAATYELKWIEDLVLGLWSPVQLKYDQHAYLGTSHWGPKRQRFYGYASNLTSSKDVYSRRKIIAVTRLKIMKKYDYGHLEEIEVRRDDQELYTFKKGDFKRLRLQDIEDMLLLLVQQRLTNLTIDE
nr:retrovirus-related Pol polyprotein from transposon TNT 1-94 [Tanacetum cinerariifolium]